LVVWLSCQEDFAVVGDKVANEGAVVVYPTDTVYGLGASPYLDNAVKKCFEIKSREEGKPMPVLFRGVEDAQRIVVMDEKARLLASTYWPGKLTLVLPVAKTSRISRQLLNVSGYLAARVPNHRCALRLIKACGGALIGTSANVSGRPSITDPEDPELFRIARKADFFIKGRSGDLGSKASTVISFSEDRTKEITVLREGAIPSKEIFALLGD